MRLIATVGCAFVGAVLVGAVAGCIGFEIATEDIDDGLAGTADVFFAWLSGGILSGAAVGGLLGFRTTGRPEPSKTPPPV